MKNNVPNRLLTTKRGLFLLNIWGDFIVFRKSQPLLLLFWEFRSGSFLRGFLLRWNLGWSGPNELEFFWLLRWWVGIAGTLISLRVSIALTWSLSYCKVILLYLYRLSELNSSGSVRYLLILRGGRHCIRSALLKLYYSTSS